MAHVIAYPHALARRDKIVRELPAGFTLGDALDALDWPLGFDQFTRIQVDGLEVSRDQWDYYEIRETDRITFYVLPGGGGGGNKQILATVALIALAVAAPGLGAAAATALGMGATAGTVIAAGITIAGSLLIGALFKPPMPRIGDTRAGAGSPAYSLQGQSNQANPFGVIPRIYGRNRVYPHVAAAPYTVNLGNANYLNVLYDFGYGPLALEDLRIGATPIGLYQGVTYYIYPSFVDGDALALYGNDTTAEGLNAALNQYPDQAQRTTVQNSMQAVLDIAFPTGLYKNMPDGSTLPDQAKFLVLVDGVPASFIAGHPSRSGPTLAFPLAGNHIPAAQFGPSTNFITDGESYGPTGPRFDTTNKISFSIWVQLNPGQVGRGVIVMPYTLLSFDVGFQTDHFFMVWHDPAPTPRLHVQFGIVSIFDLEHLTGVVNVVEWNLPDPSTAPFWHNILVSFDYGASSGAAGALCYIDDVLMTPMRDPAHNNPPPLHDNQAIRFGASGNGSDFGWNHFSGCLGEVWIHNNAINWTDAANRRKFVNADITPAYLGTRGEIPYGFFPLVYNSGPGGGASGYLDPTSFQRPRGVWTQGFSWSAAINDCPDPPVDGSTGQVVVTSDGKRDPFAISVWVALRTVGQHTITVQRLDPPPDAQREFSYRATWQGFRSIVYNEVIHPKVPHTIMEMRVRASDQLSGNIETLSAIATSLLPRWTGSGWSAPMEMRNPAWIYADILRGTANNRPVADSSIDLPALLAWAADCETEAANDPGSPQFLCDVIFDWKATVREALQTVAGCGRAGLNLRDALFSVIREDEDPVPVQVVTPRNSWGLSVNIGYLDPPDALNVSYMDELTWTQTTLPVYNDGFDESNAELFESLQLIGVVRREQAWRFGRYYIAQALLRREKATVNMDIENLVAQRGDIVAVAHDVLNVGGFPHRVLEVAGDVLTLDSPLENIHVTAFQARLNDQRGLTDIRNIVDVIDATHIEVDDVTDITAGDLIILGTVDVIVGDYIVDSIAPSTDFTAQLNLIEHRPEVLEADSGPIPPRLPKPGLLPNGELESPAPLLVTALLTVVAGQRTYDFTLTYSRSMLADNYKIFAQRLGAFQLIDQTPALTYHYLLPAAATTAQTLTFGVQAVTDWGVSSELVTATYTIDPDTDPWPAPPPPSGVICTPQLDGVEIRWDAADYDFVASYRVRLGASWTTFDQEFENTTLVLTIPPQVAGDYDVWIKTIDGHGLESDTAAHGSFHVDAPIEVPLEGDASGTTAHLVWGTLASGGWSAQTTHRIDYYEIGKALVALPLAVGRLARFAISGTRQAMRLRARLAAPRTAFTPDEIIGRVAAEFVYLFEQDAGTWTYGVRAVDVAGNAAPWAIVDLVLIEVEHFTLDHDDDLLPDSTLTHYLTLTDATILQPYDETQTWESHYVDNGFATPQAQVDAGFPLFVQPGIYSGTVLWEHDYGAPLPACRIRVRPHYADLSSFSTVSPTFATKAAPTDAWADQGSALPGVVPAGTQLIQVNVQVDPDIAGAGAIIWNRLDYLLDVTLVEESGTATVATSPTFVAFTATFIHVDSVLLTPETGGIAYATYSVASDLSGITISAFDSSDTPAAGNVSWQARGY